MATTVNQNTVRYFGNTVTGMFDPNSTKDSRIQSGINFASNVLSMVFGAISDAQDEARTAVDASKAINNDLESSVKTQAEVNKNSIKTITDKIVANQNEITNILKTINDMEKEKEAINKEVEAHQEELEKQINNYNNATTKEDRDKALAAISAENESVNELLGRVKALSNQQKELNQQGEKCQAVNGDLTAEAGQVKSEGEDKIKELQTQAVTNKAEAVALGAKETKYATKAAEYMAKALAAKSSGALSGFFSLGLGNALGEAEYQKYMQLAQSNTSAAGIIGSGVPEVMSTIGNIFDGTNTNLGYLTNTSSLIGSLTAAADGDVEAFFSTSNSVGSFLDASQNWEVTNNNIKEAINEANEDQTDVNDDSRDGDSADKNGADQKKKFAAEADYSLDMA